MANPFYDPSRKTDERTPQLLGLSAIAAYKEKADRALAELAEMNATIEELTADLEIELRDPRYELHSMTHSEPDDPYSRAHDRWAERQKLVERHLGDVEAEIAEMKEAIRNGTYEAE